MREADGNRVIAFAEKFGRYTKGPLAGKALELRDWQKQLLIDLAASNARRAYIQVAKKNGKSMLGAILALHGLCADGEAGSEVYSVAGSREQAGIVFREAKRMVELGTLHKSLHVYSHEIVHKPSGSRYKALASDAGLQDGLSPHLVIFDELHALESDRRMYDIMSLGSATRVAPLMLTITTPGVRYGRDGRDSVAWSLYDYAKRVQKGEFNDPDFFSRIWEAPAGAKLLDEEAWKLANPGLGDFMEVEALRAAARLTPENDFRTKHMGQWVSSQTAWLPAGKWDECAEQGSVPDGAQIILGFDGSLSRDATALIGATVEPNPLVFVVQVWEKPLTSPHGWQVPRAEVTETVLAACKRWKVKELVADPSLWVSEVQDWRAQRVPVIEFSQSPARMVPATKRFYESVLTQSMRHDGNPVLARHVGNAILRPTGQVAKEHKDSGRKIDAAVAAIMAYERAAIHGNRVTKPMFIKYA